MTHAVNLDPLRRAISAALIPIQTVHEIDEIALATVLDEALLCVRASKGRDLVSKALLKELLGCYSILRAEAPHFGQRKEILERCANGVESCFRLIVADELPEDRQPGVPRIV